MMQVLLVLLAASCGVCGDVHCARYDTQAKFDLLAAQAGIEGEADICARPVRYVISPEGVDSGPQRVYNRIRGHSREHP